VYLLTRVALQKKRHILLLRSKLKKMVLSRPAKTRTAARELMSAEGASQFTAARQLTAFYASIFAVIVVFTVIEYWLRLVTDATLPLDDVLSRCMLSTLCAGVPCYLALRSIYENCNRFVPKGPRVHAYAMERAGVHVAGPKTERFPYFFAPVTTVVCLGFMATCLWLLHAYSTLAGYVATLLDAA
jgi:hypothetical protein